MGNSYALHKECLDEKAIYNQCDAAYWRDFRSGATLANPCRDEWDDYQQCIVNKIQENIQKSKDRKSGTEQKPSSEHFTEHPINHHVDTNDQVPHRKK